MKKHEFIHLHLDDFPKYLNNKNRRRTAWKNKKQGIMKGSLFLLLFLIFIFNVKAKMDIIILEASKTSNGDLHTILELKQVKINDNCHNFFCRIKEAGRRLVGIKLCDEIEDPKLKINTQGTISFNGPIVELNENIAEKLKYFIKLQEKEVKEVKAPFSLKNFIPFSLGTISITEEGARKINYFLVLKCQNTQ